ncbi:VirE N-terminal domain-containing protein [Nitritalea halalkaliphila LW7]|uniref:VirE N-terminal domain-containing protein n=1 Tax=Nitritalea halalkaliphila LW7 TaxID=1189621 RepID=I5C064_9BACT|nr:CRISPR-associated primase-polymerase type B [Nitritalea halalkaliphila]EIM75216.1 VirE N-terminal domain-containing protein [Nitritalea halalkaliphila LW7]
MIRLGKHVTQAGDQLQDVTIDKLHLALRNPAGQVASLQRKLQALRAMDPAQYRRLKTTLPYIVCAQFHPKIRRKENFLYTDRFLLDIDHMGEHGLSKEELKGKLIEDPRVELLFTSPSGDGLKVMFRLSPSITDPAYYSVFYKAFCQAFGEEYQLGSALDHKTHDVSRCCFVSFDPDAFYRADAQEVNPEDFVQKESFTAIEEVEKAARAIEKAQKAQLAEKQKELKVHPGQELPDEVLNFIKQKTGLKVKKPVEKHYEQPEELEAVMEQLKGYLEEINAEIEHVRPIAYGRQVKIRSGKIWAEVNVFFSPRGVRVVGTLKTGSHREFAKTLAEFLKASFDNDAVDGKA